MGAKELIALRTALRDEAKGRLEVETQRLKEELAVREGELAEAKRATKRAR